MDDLLDIYKKNDSDPIDSQPFLAVGAASGYFPDNISNNYDH